jgi:AraC-like DNA-binding protein
MSMRDATVGYDDAAQSVAILRPRLLRMLSCIVHLHGGDPARLCAGLGFTHQDLNDPERRFSFRQLGEMLRRTLRALPDPGVLIRAAGEAKITAYDMLGLAQQSCPRLREALELGVEFQRLAGMPADLSLEEEGDEFSFILDEWYHDPQIGPFLIEMTCAFVVNEIGLLVGRRFVPVRVELAYPATPGRAAYRGLFDHPVTFAAPRNRIVGRRAMLDETLPTRDRLTHDSLVVDLRRAVVAQVGDLLEAVGHALRKNLRNPPSVAELAASMHMSERSLRRRLADMDVNVRDLLAQVRTAVARRLLHDQDRSVAEVADLVGFSSPENFRRALRRWTGACPSALRAEQQAARSPGEARRRVT